MRIQARDEILREASIYLENFYITSGKKLNEFLDSNSDFAQQYSLFLETLQLGSLFFTRGKIKTNLVIPLRGKKGLLRYIPLPWNTESYQLLKEKEYIGEAYMLNSIKGEYFPRLAPIIYSGLIIDATDFTINPSLAPRIYSEEGRLIYGPEFITSRTGIDRGVAAYVNRLKDSEVLNRAGKNPLLSVAIAIRGRHQADFVITEESVAKLFDHPDNIENLKKCRVVILYKKLN